MTATLSTRTLQQRSVEATRRLREVLGLDDLKVLSTAVAVVVAEDAARDATYADRVRRVYQDLLSLQATRPVGGKKPKNDVMLVPVAGVDDTTIDPYAPLDAYRLNAAYGPHQLRQALSVYSLAKLKQALAAVEGRNPGTKPTNRSRKDAIIDYIVERVAGPTF